MPVVNGQKMACEPCIRGHRSTKCNHAGERILVCVRKPGRPLSTCPHPPGKNCQCRNNVTAAIPRGATCHCNGSSSSKPKGTPAIVKAEPSDGLPQSPAKQPSFRIQKSMTKTSRKSSDASSLQRMAPSSLNNLISAANALVAPASPNYANYIPSVQDGAHQYPTYPQMNSHMNGADSSLVSLNGGMSGMSLVQTSSNEVSDSSGTLTPGTSGSPYQTPTSSNGDSASMELPLEAVGSCCSQRVQHQPQMQKPPQIQTQPQAQAHMQFQGPVQPRPQEPSNMMGYMPQTFTNNGSMANQFPQQMVAGQQVYPMNQFNQPVNQASLYPADSSFGTPHFPLQQSQWEQLMASLISQTQAEQNGNGQGSYTDHECTCGSDCDCLGCLAHPYNQATRQYVREVMAFQDSNMDTGNSMPDPQLAVGEASSQATQSPSEMESPGANDQNLSPSEFLFVDYGSGMCGCGDDCACVNCMIHRDTMDPKNHIEPQDRTPN